MCNGVIERVDNVKRGRDRPKLMWDESVKRDLKDWNISKEIDLDMSAWRLAINVTEGPKVLKDLLEMDASFTPRLAVASRKQVSATQKS